MSLKPLHSGIAVPEHSVTVPWLISRQALYSYIPRTHFRLSPADWPVLTFTCLGIKADFAFYFAGHADDKLLSLHMIVDDSPISTVNGLPAQLLGALGAPTRQDINDFRWFDDQIVVDCWVCVRRRQPGEAAVYEFSKLKICYSAGWPDHWNNKHGVTSDT